MGHLVGDVAQDLHYFLPLHPHLGTLGSVTPSRTLFPTFLTLSRLWATPNTSVSLYSLNVRTESDLLDYLLGFGLYFQLTLNCSSLSVSAIRSACFALNNDPSASAPESLSLVLFSHLLIKLLQSLLGPLPLGAYTLLFCSLDRLLFSNRFFNRFPYQPTPLIYCFPLTVQFLI